MAVLVNKVAIVTGAGSGLGRSIARAFAAEGAVVCVVDRNAASGEATVQSIVAAGGKAMAQPADVGVRAQVDAVVAAVVAQHATVDIVVNAAYANPSFGRPFDVQTEQDLMVNLSSSLLGTWNFMQACFPYLRRQGGKVINFSSAAFTEGLPGSSPYAAAKGAVVGLTNCVALEWGQYGININLISPVSWTPAYDQYLAVMPPGTHEKHLEQNPMRRLGDADRDIAPVAVFLASAASNYITGRTFSVDGGRGLLRV